MPKKIAVIGSFKQNYQTVLEAIDAFRQAGHAITTPLGDPIVKPGIPFVRFTSDDPALPNAAIQSLTMQRIFGAELVFVVAPRGYVGRTTCYEIGRVFQARWPIYFSEAPHDLPVELPKSHILSAAELVAAAVDPHWTPSWPFVSGTTQAMELERGLRNVT